MKTDVFASLGELCKPPEKTIPEKMIELSEKQEGLIKSLGKQARPFVRPAHGLNGIDSCLYCDREINHINPGKLVYFPATHNQPARNEHVCLICFNGQDYQESIDGLDVTVTEYKL